MSFPVGSDGKESTCNAGDIGSIPGREDPLEEGMASRSRILAWRIPQTVLWGAVVLAGLAGRKESDTTEQLNNNISKKRTH